MDAKNIKELFMKQMWEQLSGYEHSSKVKELVEEFGGFAESYAACLNQATKHIPRTTGSLWSEKPCNEIFLPDSHATDAIMYSIGATPWNNRCVVLKNVAPVVKEAPELKVDFMGFGFDEDDTSIMLDGRFPIEANHMWMSEYNKFVPITNYEDDINEECEALIDGMSKVFENSLNMGSALQVEELNLSNCKRIDWNFAPSLISTECQHKNKRKIDLFTSSMYECVDCKKDLGNA
jgi:hypothetical protein